MAPWVDLDCWYDRAERIGYTVKRIPSWPKQPSHRPVTISIMVSAILAFALIMGGENILWLIPQLIITFGLVFHYRWAMDRSVRDYDEVIDAVRNNPHMLVINREVAHQMASQYHGGTFHILPLWNEDKTAFYESPDDETRILVALQYGITHNQ